MRKGVRNELLGACAVAGAVCLARKKVGGALGFTALAGALYLANRGHDESFRGKSVVITGGSRGLGLALAVQFAREGARVAILARDGSELAHAAMILKQQAGASELMAVACDVTDTQALERALKKVARIHRGIDVLVNNAGAITVGPFSSMEREDFEAQMKLHLFAVIESCRLALPELKKRRGRIVNICSMGGRVAVPHMLPYDASKFALSGFSQGLMAELSGQNVSVTTIYPALMRTGSPIQAVFKGDHEKEYAWFAAADVLPGLSLSAESAAEKIVESARRRDAELIPSLPGKARMVAAAFFPETLASLMGWLARLMPTGHSLVHQTGHQSRGLLDRLWLASPLRLRASRAEAQWNQWPHEDAGRQMGLR